MMGVVNGGGGSSSEGLWWSVGTVQAGMENSLETNQVFSFKNH